jgi:hypothetical protein
LAQRAQDGRGSGTGPGLGQPGVPAYLGDEVIQADGPGLGPVPPGLPLLARAGQLGGQAPGLAATELARDRLQDRPAEIRSLLARQAAALGDRAGEFLLVHAGAPFAMPGG